jgi:hypothetical protein
LKTIFTYVCKLSNKEHRTNAHAECHRCSEAKTQLPALKKTSFLTQNRLKTPFSAHKHLKTLQKHPIPPTCWSVSGMCTVSCPSCKCECHAVCHRLYQSIQRLPALKKTAFLTQNRLKTPIPPSKIHINPTPTCWSVSGMCTVSCPSCKCECHAG